MNVNNKYMYFIHEKIKINLDELYTSELTKIVLQNYNA